MEIFSLKKLVKDSTNIPVEILRVKNLVELGVLRLEPNAKVPVEGFSIHENSHEFGYLIEGEVLVVTDKGEENIFKEGELLYNKPGTPHYTFNKSLKPAKIFWFVIPPLKN